ncbi:vanadium-dependent haloperoxidase [Nostoc sp.]|uniref:vanadium-dependent haloperoxidase n=1 Tax=Nostoc sp. TaxID=1180 RepID=UPI002FF6419B
MSLVITNRGTAKYQGSSLSLNIYASPDAILDKSRLNTPKKIIKLSNNSFTSRDPLEGTDELLGTLRIPNVKLNPGQSQKVTVDFTSSDLRNPSVVAPGAYYLIAEISPSTTSHKASDKNKVASQFISTGDPVIVWNATTLNATVAAGKVLRDEYGAIIERRIGTGPTLVSRNQAIVHAAIYDAVNAITRSHKSLYVNFDACDYRVVGASLEAAVAGAAYTALVNIYPDQKATFDEQLSRSLAQIPDGRAERKGLALGRTVAEQILKLRSNDGSAQAGQIPFKEGSNPGEWRLTPPDFGKPVSPGWGLVTPFSHNIPARQAGDDPIPRLQQFNLTGPVEFGSKQFVDETNFVRQHGGLDNTDATKIVRTADQTESALFWSLDRPDTFKPAGQWNEIAQELALEKGNTLEENALLFAQLNIAEADAAILTWDAKYTYNQLRPITSIRQELLIDKSDVVQDVDWKPLLVDFKPEEYGDFPLTPGFPDYYSGHAAYGNTAGQVLINFFGNNTPLTLVSQDLPGVSRSYNTILEAIEDNAASRIYGGVHIPSSTITQIPTLGGVDPNPTIYPTVFLGAQVADLVASLF